MAGIPADPPQVAAERREFERWIVLEAAFWDGALRRDPQGNYFSVRADMAWRAWLHLKRKALR